MQFMDKILCPRFEIYPEPFTPIFPSKKLGGQDFWHVLNNSPTRSLYCHLDFCILFPNPSIQRNTLQRCAIEYITGAKAQKRKYVFLDAIASSSSESGGGGGG